MEIWKVIDGFDRYEVSSNGRVKSLYDNFGRRRDRILTLNHQKTGYYTVTLCKDGKKQVSYVHRLVAETFILNPNDYPVVNHKDEIKTNNNVDNLEWCTAKYNSNYGTSRERLSKSMMGNTNGVGKPSPFKGKKRHNDESKRRISEYWRKRREEKTASRDLSE